jgi:Xaa-Pro dipeptidase
MTTAQPPNPEDAALFPRFSTREFERRFRAVRALMEREGVQALVLHGTGATQNAMHYLTNYYPWVPAWLVFPREGPSSLYLHFANHIPCTRVMSIVDDVRCYWPSAANAVGEDLKARGLGAARVGIYGLAQSIPHLQFMALQRAVPEVEFVDLGRQYDAIRLVRSEEEIEWFRRSARLCDLTCEALETRIKPGMTEHDLSVVVHEAFIPEGGQMGIHFMSATNMDAPDRYVPWQFATARRLAERSVLITEITIAYWTYGAQIHRPFAVGAEPTPLYRRIYDVALECFEAIRQIARPGTTSEQIVAATRCVEEAGFSAYDSVFHGEMGKGPELGTTTSGHPLEPYTLRENQVVVIQPNPITRDHTAGLQLGAAVVVRPSGGEILHSYPFKFVVCR